MMLKEKSSPWARLKYLYVFPLAAIAVTAFARPEISEKVKEISAVKVNDLAEIVQEKVLQDTVKVSKVVKKADPKVAATKKKEEEEIVIFEVVEQMPEYPGGMDALSKYLESKVADSPMKGKAGGLVTIGFTVTGSGKVTNVQVLGSDQPSLNKEAERIVSEMPDWIPGKQRGKPVPVKYSVPVRFGNIRFGLDKQPLILADGKEISMNAMERMNPSDIESVSVLKDSASIKIYGKRGENGVILVTTKKPGTTTQFNFSKVDNQENVVPDFQVSGTVVVEQGRPKAGVSILVPNTTYGTITDIDGRFSLKAESITILKDKSAAVVYGDKAKNGVIVIEMLTDEEFQAKKNNPQPAYTDAWQLAESAAKDMEGEVIYLLDGKEVNAGKLQQMSAKAIKSASADRVDGRIVIRLVSEK